MSDNRAANGEKVKLRWQDPTFRAKHLPAMRNNGAKTKDLWTQPEYRARMVARMKEVAATRPTVPPSPKAKQAMREAGRKGWLKATHRLHPVLQQAHAKRWAFAEAARILEVSA